MNKIFSFLGRVCEKLVQWILWSSKNEANLSLTLKAGIPFILLLHIGTAQSLGYLADGIVNFLVLLATWLTGAMAVWGALRKIVTTVHNLFVPPTPF